MPESSQYLVPSRPALPEIPAPRIDGKSADQYAEAQRRLHLVQVYRAQMAEGLKPNDAVDRMHALGFVCSRATLDRWSRGLASHGWEGLFDRREQRGRKPAHGLTLKQVAQLAARRLGTNRTSDDGSTPEAIRAAIRHGEIPPEIAAELLERDRTGTMATPALHRAIAAPHIVTRTLRNASEAALDFYDTPGSTMFLTDERTGERRFVRVGDILEADDATVNFYVCVPWEMGGCPCSEKYGVKIARWQWLVTIDRASRYVPGYSFTMRPKSSYRGEDVIGLFHAVFRQHGIWQRLCLERGVWESNRVEDLITRLGVQRNVAYTPHQKPYIEGLFSLMWTKLSELPGQVGRFAGDEEKMEAVAESCRRGATDPREVFPMLAHALPAFNRAIAERNGQPVKSTQFGTWVPQERWLAQQTEARDTQRLRTLADGAAWMFAPIVRQIKVTGNTLKCSVQLMEGVSTQFAFSRDDLALHDGALVSAYFNPFAPSCNATLVLEENSREGRKGEVLGEAFLVSETARYARRALGYGDDADMTAVLKQNAKVVRHEIRTTKAGGDLGLTITQLRDADGASLKIERNAADVGRASSPAQESGVRDQSSETVTETPRSALRAPRSKIRDLVEALKPDTQEEFTARRGKQERMREARQEITQRAQDSALTAE